MVWLSHENQPVKVAILSKCFASNGINFFYGRDEAVQHRSTGMMATRTTQIELDEQGMAWIASTRTKLIEVVMDTTVHGWSAEEIHSRHPHLSLAQIDAALTFYYENRTAFDEQIARSLADVAAVAELVSDPDFQDRLLMMKSSR